MGMPVKHIDKDRFMVLWNAGDSHKAMAAAFGVSDNTIERRAREWGLPPRFRQRKGIQRNQPAPLVQDAPEPTQHVAAVRMPSSAIEGRTDWPQISAAIDKARGSTVALGQVAARFRLPYSVVKGLAQRVAA